MTRPNYPNCIMTPGVIQGVRERQENYDKNPEEAERQQQAEKEAQHQQEEEAQHQQEEDYDEYIKSVKESNMEIENQLVNLELAKKLDKLGIKEDSYFVWIDKFPMFVDKEKIVTRREFEDRLPSSSLSEKARKLVKAYPAYTVAELGEMLPAEVKQNNKSEEIFGKKEEVKYIGMDFWEEQANNSYGIRREYRVSVGGKQFVEDTEANARAKMLIYLIENNLITINKEA